MTDRRNQEFDTSTTDGWLNELAFQLRLRGATGAEVGDALAEAGAHLRDSGETPLNAFGDPRQYAAQLLPGSRPEGLGTYVGALLAGAGVYLAIVLGTDAVLHWGDPVPVRLGTLVALLVLAVAILVLVAFSSQIFDSRGMWALAVLMAAALAGVIIPGVLLTRVVTTLPHWVGVLLAVVMLAAGVVALLRTRRDPVRGPAGMLVR